MLRYIKGYSDIRGSGDHSIGPQIPNVRQCTEAGSRSHARNWSDLHVGASTAVRKGGQYNFEV